MGLLRDGAGASSKHDLDRATPLTLPVAAAIAPAPYPRQCEMAIPAVGTMWRNTLQNPYLDDFRWSFPPQGETVEARRARRFAMCSRYSWSVPSEEAIELLVRLSPLVELGAGTGYWAWMIRAAGGDIAAYDSHPPGQGRGNGWHGRAPCSFTYVARGSTEVLSKHFDRTLLLCWPPYSEQHRPATLAAQKDHLRQCMAYKALRAWRGDRVVYVGEWRSCTAGWAFHDLLERRYRTVAEISLPTWPGIVDRLSVHERLQQVWARPRDDETQLPSPAPSPVTEPTTRIGPVGP